MSREFIDRLQHALIGFVVGVFLGGMLWCLYGLGFSRTSHAPGSVPSAVPWLLGAGFVFALLGFLLKDGAADLFGDSMATIYDVESGAWWNHSWVKSLLAMIAGAAIVVFIVWPYVRGRSS